MGIPMALNDIVQLTFQGRLFNQTVMTVLHYKLTSVGSLTAFGTWAPALNTLLITPVTGLASYYVNCCSENYGNAIRRIQKIYPTRLVQAVYTDGPDEGTIVEGALPPGVSGSLTKRSDVAGRHALGGVRMPALPITANESGYVSLIQLNLYSDLCTQLQAPISSATVGNLQPIIFNRTAPSLSLDVKTVSPEETLRTMSRRVLFRGI